MSCASSFLNQYLVYSFLPLEFNRKFSKDSSLPDVIIMQIKSSDCQIFLFVENRNMKQVPGSKKKSKRILTIDIVTVRHIFLRGTPHHEFIIHFEIY